MTPGHRPESGQTPSVCPLPLTDTGVGQKHSLVTIPFFFMDQVTPVLSTLLGTLHTGSPHRSTGSYGSRLPKDP